MKTVVMIEFAGGGAGKKHLSERKKQENSGIFIKAEPLRFLPLVMRNF